MLCVVEDSAGEWPGFPPALSATKFQLGLSSTRLGLSFIHARSLPKKRRKRIPELRSRADLCISSNRIRWNALLLTGDTTPDTTPEVATLKAITWQAVGDTTAASGVVKGVSPRQNKVLHI